MIRPNAGDLVDEQPSEWNRERQLWELRYYGAFSILGGHIVGRHIEMAPYERLVQAWREISWPPGVYSIVKFELREKGAGSNLVFDHTGFPEGAAPHLAIGWKANYWDPLKTFLA